MTEREEQEGDLPSNVTAVELLSSFGSKVPLQELILLSFAFKRGRDSASYATSVMCSSLVRRRRLAEGASACRRLPIPCRVDCVLSSSSARDHTNQTQPSSYEYEYRTVPVRVAETVVATRTRTVLIRHKNQKCKTK